MKNIFFKVPDQRTRSNRKSLQRRYMILMSIPLLLFIIGLTIYLLR